MARNNVRHVRVPTDGYRQKWLEKVVYANDMTQGAGATIGSVGVSPSWSLANAADQYMYADLKLPIDRVPGSPILIKIVYASDGGGGNFLFYVGVLIASLGTDLTTAISRMFSTAVSSPANLMNVAPTITLQSTELDNLVAPVDIQLQIGREGAHALDTSTDAAIVTKVIYEYYAYI